jgi:outer membrane lipase/esterase
MSTFRVPTATLGRVGRRLAATVLLFPAAVAAQRSSYTSITFFGDSYVDTGNARLLSNGAQPPSPPYALGRFSNGMVFTDYLAQALNRPGDATPVFLSRAASGNYAVGGARTDSPSVGTASQINSYLGRTVTTPGTLTDPTGLYVLFVGGNDLRDAGGLATEAERQAGAAAAAQRVINQASQLAGAGARNIVLFSLPSLGATPEALATPGRPAIADRLAATFNSTLAGGIMGLQNQIGATTFLNFRLDNLYANILADAMAGGGRYGLTNLTVPCFTTGAPSCDVSVFADAIHPTTRVHQIFGQSLATYVTSGANVAVVPEPATVALVGAGVAVLAGVARRRRAA